MSGAAHDIVFYDGACGMCHRLVKFTLKRDRSGVFRFAPLQGETLCAMLAEADRARLPDSVVVRAADGRVLVRVAATRHILGRLGWFWRVLGAVMGVVPRAARDWAYDLVARTRHRLFKRPGGACPLVPSDLRDRFLP